MSLQEQKARIDKAKADIISAVWDKAPAIPQDARLDQIPEYIRMIQGEAPEDVKVAFLFKASISQPVKVAFVNNRGLGGAMNIGNGASIICRRRSLLCVNANTTSFKVDPPNACVPVFTGNGVAFIPIDPCVVTIGE